MFGAPADELAYAVLHAGGDDEIFRLVLLQHHPLHAHVVLGVAPVAQRIDVAHVQAAFQPLGDVGEAAGDLAGDEGFATARAFMVEQDAVAGVEAVGFAVVDGDPVGVHLGDGIRAARVEGRGFLLRDFLDQAVEFGGGSLVEAGFLFQAKEADGFEQAQGANGVDIGGVFRGFEADGHVRLGAEVVDLVRLHFLQDAGEVGGVGEIAVVELEAGVVDVRVFVDVIDALGVEQGGAALDAVHFVTLFEQEFGKVGAVLAGNAGDEGGFFGLGGHCCFSLGLGYFNFWVSVVSCFMPAWASKDFICRIAIAFSWLSRS